MSEELLPQDSTPAVESTPVESSASPEPVEQTSTENVSPEPTRSVWDSFKGLPDFEGQDERSIAQSLYESFEREKAATHSLQQYQQLIPYAQEYLDNKEAFEQYRQGQAQPQQVQQPAAAPQAEEPESWWNPPAVKPEHKRYLVRDENGREAVAENAPLDARYAIENYLNHRAEFAQKFLDNPEEALGPMVQQMAMQQAQEMIEQELGARDETNQVSSLEQENADWLYEADGKTPTKEGLAIQQYIKQAVDMGISGVEQRWNYATSMVERDLLNQRHAHQAQAAQAQQFQQSLPPQQAAPAPQQPAPVAQNSAEKDIEFLRREASRNPSHGGGNTKQGGGEASAGTFEDRLKSQLQRDNLI